MKKKNFLIKIKLLPTSKVFAPEIKSEGSYISVFQEILNLCKTLSQFFIAIVTMCECFAFTTVSIVYSAVGGVETPVKLYKRALPSGRGKKRVPS